jgi:hypothetical protein
VRQKAHTGECNVIPNPQMLHVWVVPYPGGVFSDDLSAAATNAAAQAALAETKPGQLAP